MSGLLDWIKTLVPEAQGLPFCDTSPLLERSYARRAGLGWQGKNAMLIAPSLGLLHHSWAVDLALDLELPSDEPEADHCGSCRRCLEACPTDASPAPGSIGRLRAASPTSRSRTKDRCPRSSAPASATGCSAATSARKSARGTASRSRPGPCRRRENRWKSRSPNLAELRRGSLPPTLPRPSRLPRQAPRPPARRPPRDGQLRRRPLPPHPPALRDRDPDELLAEQARWSLERLRRGTVELK